MIPILHLEDDPLDSRLVADVLREEGLEVELERVHTLLAFEQALACQGLQLIISDFTLPGMSAMDALRLARERRPEVPFMFLSGTIGEEMAIQMLKAGAADYVLKEHTSRLAPAVRRALREAEQEARRRESEAALRESEERLRFAMETSHTGAWDLDLEEHTSLRSVEHDRIFGYRDLLPEWTYERFLEHVLPEDRAEVDRKFRQALATQSDWHFECRIRRADGQVRWIWAAGRPRGDTAGRRLAGIVQDITERKQAQDSLAERARLLDLSFDALIVRDGQDRIAYWNHGAEEMYGWREAEARGKVTHLLLQTEFPKPLESILEELRRQGRWSGELLHTRRDGARIVVATRWTLDRQRRAGQGWILETNTDITSRKGAEVALARERAFVEAVLQACPAGIIVAEPGGKLVRMNPANERLWGLAPFAGSVEEYREWKGWWADGSARQGRRLEPQEWALARALRGEVCPGDIVEIEPFGAPGTRRTMLNSGAPVRGANGEILGAVVVQVDITALKQAQRALLESEAKFRTLADNMSQFAWMADAQGYIFWYNRRWFEYTGTTLEQMQGWGWQAVHHPEHVARVTEGFKRALQSGEPWEDTFPLRSKNGEFRWFLSRAMPIRNEQGQVVRWFGTNTDVTEQKRAEEEVRNSEQRAWALFDSNVIGVVYWSFDGGITKANDRFLEMVGCSREELAAGRINWERMTPPEYRPLDQRVVAALKATGRHPAYEKEYIRKDGIRFPVVLGSAKMSESGGVAFVLDITERKRAEAELERLVKERTTQLAEANANLQAFSYTAAHDLRSPLRSIKTFSTIVVEEHGKELGAEGRSLLERVVGSVGQMEGLLNDLLEYSKMSQAELKLGTVDLGAAVREALALLDGDVRDKNAVITVREPLPEVVGHQTTVVLLVNNFVSNALKFIAPGVRPQLRIWAESGGGTEHLCASPHLRVSESFVRLWVEDNGIGIAPKDLGKIFGAFERLHGKQAYPGTGLGLAIARKAAERMGGRVGVESEVGKGSRFWVEFRSA